MLNLIFNWVFPILDQRDQGEKQRRKMTASGEAKNLVVQNLRPGKLKI